jgi:DNA-binding transcriptional LysR family regulator
VQIQQLAVFVAVAELGSFTKAAERMQLSQPALSKHLANLERELGTPLLRRRRTGATLTPAGEALLPLARRILNDVETARFEVHALEELRGGKVRLGTIPSLCTGLVADALHQFHERYPGVRLLVEETGSRALVGLLGQGELDLAVIHIPLLAGDPPLVTTTLLTEELVLATNVHDHSLGNDPVPVSVLRDRDIVSFRERYELRAITVTACREAGFEPRFSVEGGQMAAVLGFVAAGLGVAIVPRMVLRGRPGLRGVPFAGRGLTRTIAVAHRRDIPPPQAVRALRATLLATAAEFSFGTADS